MTTPRNVCAGREGVIGMNLEQEMLQQEERFLVRELGVRIGFGNLMTLAAAEWADWAVKNNVRGSSFLVGPCQAFAVPCVCADEDSGEDRSHCDFCCGSGWLTRRVKEVVSNAEDRKNHKKHIAKGSKT